MTMNVEIQGGCIFKIYVAHKPQNEILIADFEAVQLVPLLVNAIAEGRVQSFVQRLQDSESTRFICPECHFEYAISRGDVSAYSFCPKCSRSNTIGEVLEAFIKAAGGPQ